MASLFNRRLKKVWNAFRDQEESEVINASPLGGYGMSYSQRPDRMRARITNERTIISSIHNRISVDAAGISIRHVVQDKSGRYKETRKSALQECLSLSANIDQTARHFRQDIYQTLLEKGSIAIVPVDRTDTPDSESASYDILSLRVGEIVQFYPHHVRVSVYNENTAMREELTLSKSYVAIVENPFYAVMNEPNSTLSRLTNKLSMLDSIDRQASAGNLDLIIQLPYVIKSEARKTQAEQRRKDIEMQLRDSSLGIAYTDGTERITQLNRPVENKLLKQVEYLTKMLYDQLGITPELMNGTASEQEQVAYHANILVPLLDAVTQAMARTFLSRTARSQGQAIMYFKDPFALMTLGNFAEIADKLTRNEIATSNELRSAIGLPPSEDPKADKLQNSNMPQPADSPPGDSVDAISPGGELQNET